MLIEFSTYPIGESSSLSKAVSEVIDIIDRSGLSYKTHAMGTVVEGEWDELMQLIRTCHFHLRDKFDRVATRIVIDDRRDAVNRLEGKLDTIEKRLGRQIRK
ncbi:MAG: MTH1187 family thiamine-binding protein [candidate division Zixibacteria bacterium]|nr:MTH1187 family thiamine-binding protein [candidate division Zixibacteria bacterium]MBU1470362.1 MTH1187 family thiamine-binding protein [candidate division Zixibacteria bacterium]MBU2624910.1 MTH1187 family thiamine-binding protein [candidate division Zixibacteria bacterium]